MQNKAEKENQEARIMNQEYKTHNSLFLTLNSQSERPPKIMLVDMNSFFASVEQQANPFFRGKPLGVCASLHETSCLIATSKEAKALGIKTGTVVYQAKKICPKIILCQAEPAKYREVNRQINQIFSDYTDQVEVYSIDESFLDFRGNNAPGADAPPPLNLRGGALGKGSRGSYNLLAIGAEIKKRIREEVGEWLTCSVGIAPNKFMAKLAADLEKPDGLSIVWRSQLPEIYKSKKLSDLWGISRGWTKRLAKLDITEPGQLLNHPVQNLIAVFGKPGFYLWERVNGLEEDEGAPRQNEGRPRSFGHSWVLNFRTTDKEKLKVVILRLAEKAARRMRKDGFQACGIYLSVLLADGNYFHRSKKLGFVVATGLELYQQALKIWEPWDFKKEAMQIAVGFTSLQPKVTQLSLLPDKYENLTPTLDQINDKYGEFTIRSSLLTQTRDFAPDAIAFGK